MNNLLKNNGFFKWVWKHKVPILVIEVIACAAAIVLSSPYFITPEFKSSAVVYPYNLNEYSKESASEQMLQFLASTDIKNDVIKEFNLIKHYKIDTTQKYWYTDLLEKYDRNVIVNSTEYEAVKIAVYDVDPELAYKMVQGILDALNKKVLTIQKEKSEETARMLKKQLDAKKRQVDSLAAISKQLSVQYGILDYGTQTREVERAYYQMLSASKTGKPLEEASNQIKNLEEKGQQFREVDAHLGSAIGEYDGILLKYEDVMKDVNKQLTYSNMVETPYPADKKSYPIRWLIVLVTAIGSFVFSAVVLGFMERVKE